MADTSLLVVEDESIVAMDIKHRAEGLGYNVLGIASSGEEAIEKTEKNRPDLILMDIVLKGKMDGVQAAQIIRDKFDIPVVYLTAYSDEKTLGRAKLTGPFGYIIKPFEDRELHSAVEVALYKHKMDSKLKESEERYRALFESSPDPILLLDINGNITFINYRVETLFGMRRKKVIGKSLSTLSEWGFVDKSTINTYFELIPTIVSEGRIDSFEMKITDKNKNAFYFETFSTLITSEERGPIIQLIGHDITSRVEAEEQKIELIREKARVELYGFVVSAVPVFASSIPPQLRNTIIKNFADRFEQNVKPNFYKEMSNLGLLNLIKENPDANRTIIFDSYLTWLKELLSNLGIESRVKPHHSKYKLEFITFPWIEEARQNPIFSLIFRAMIIRSFTWTGLKGNVTQTSSLLEGSKNIQFEFHLPH